MEMTSSSSSNSRVDPAPRQDAISVDHLFRVFRRRGWAVLLCVLLMPVLAFGLSTAQTKQYTATASLLFTNSSVAQQASGVQAVSQSDPQGQRNTNLALVQLGNTVAQTTATSLHAGLTPAQIKGAVSATEQGASNVASVSATWTSPALAAAIANTYTQEFIAQQLRSDQATVQNAINLVHQQYTGLTHPQRLTPQGQSLLDHLESLKILKTMQNSTQLVQAATVPKAPSSPKVLRNTVLGLVLGLILGFGVAFLLERLDRRLREPQDIEESFGLPLLGLIPRGATQIQGGLESREPFRMLRAHLRYFNVDRELKVLLVTSSRPAEGKTTIASNLAATAAAMGTKTLLIEADLRKPTLRTRLGLEPGIGLSGALVSTGSLSDAVQQVDVQGDEQTNGSGGRLIDVLLAGAVPPNPTELLESHAMENLLAWAREHYDFVVIDTAPLSIVADTIPLMKIADGVIIVSRIGVSTRDGAENLRERLHNLGAPMLGVVVNDVRARTHAYYGYGYYGTGEKSTEEPSSRSKDAATNGHAKTADAEDATEVVRWKIRSRDGD